jgi:hypothetical protein
MSAVDTEHPEYESPDFDPDAHDPTATHPEDPDDTTDPTATDWEIVGMPSGQLSFNVGGKKPDTSTLRLSAHEIAVPGQVRKGDEVVIQVRIRVEQVVFRDRIDGATQQVIGCTRKQVARIVGPITVVD